MGKKTSKESSENGLELDKITLSNLSSNSVPQKPTPKSPPAAEKNDHQEKKWLRPALIVTMTTLAVLICLFIVLNRQDFSFSFLSSKTGNTAENCLRVGPISATLANDDIINFSLDIDCGSESLKERLSGRDSQLRDKILAVITAPGTDKLLENKQYEEVKTKIRESLGTVISEPIGEIYFAEMIMY